MSKSPISSDVAKYIAYASNDFIKWMRDIESEKKNRRMWKLARKRK